MVSTITGNLFAYFRPSYNDTKNEKVLASQESERSQRDNGGNGLDMSRYISEIFGEDEDRYPYGEPLGVFSDRYCEKFKQYNGTRHAKLR